MKIFFGCIGFIGLLSALFFVDSTFFGQISFHSGDMAPEATYNWLNVSVELLIFILSLVVLIYFIFFNNVKIKNTVLTIVIKTIIFFGMLYVGLILMTFQSLLNCHGGCL